MRVPQRLVGVEPTPDEIRRLEDRIDDSNTGEARRRGFEPVAVVADHPYGHGHVPLQKCLDAPGSTVLDPV